MAQGHAVGSNSEGATNNHIFVAHRIHQKASFRFGCLSKNLEFSVGSSISLQILVKNHHDFFTLYASHHPSNICNLYFRA
jgi:hypothetical protein